MELGLAEDKLRTAVDWADEKLQEGGLKGRPDSKAAQLAMARVLIVKGDDSALDRAGTLLATLLLAAQAVGRTGIPMGRLLPAARSRQVLAGYVQELVGAFEAQAALS